MEDGFNENLEDIREITWKADAADNEHVRDQIKYWCLQNHPQIALERTML